MIAVLLCLLLSPDLHQARGPVDTIPAASVFSSKMLPASKPAETVSLEQLPAAPVQLADVLRRFTGVQVKDYGGMGGLKTVNVRSLGSEHTALFLDGIQVDNAQNMQVDLGRFTTEGLGAISLYNGRKAHRLQTAKEYAAGASVHLESAPPTIPRFTLRLKGGSLGTINPSFRRDRPFGNRLTLRTSAELLYSQGRYRFPYFDTTLIRENDDIRSLRLEAQLFGRLPRGDWQVRAYTYGSERGFPGPVVRRAERFPFSAERQADQDLFVQGAWRSEWTGRHATAVRFKLARNYTHYDTHPEKNPMALPYDLHYLQRSSYLSLAQTFTISDAWAADLAADWQRNALDSDVGQFVTPRRNTLTTAVAGRYTRERFRAVASLVWQGAWDRFDTPQAGLWSREAGFRGAWMPSVNLFWHPISLLEVEVFARKSDRLPSFNDLYYSVMGNSSLVPETAWQTGADLRLSLSRDAWQWGLRFSPYRNRVSHKIVAIPTASQFRWTMLNIGLVDITGLDIKGEAAFRRDGWAWEGIVRYTFQQALDHSDPEGLTFGNQIPYIPRHSGGIFVQVRREGWSLSWDSTLTGRRWSRSANIADYAIDPWHLAEAVLAWEGARIKAGLRVSNVFDRPYQIVQGYPMPGRTILLTLQFLL